MKTPVLKRHQRGTWYTRYWLDGKTHSKYFTTDHTQSKKLFRAWLTDEWLQLKLKSPAPESSSAIRITQIAEQWLGHIHVTRGAIRMGQYRAATQNFINITGEMPARDVTVDDLQAHAADLKEHGYSVNAVRSYVKAVKQMLLWASRRRRKDGTRLIPRPDFTELKLDAPTRPTPRYYPPRFIRDYIDNASRTDAQLHPWLSLIYLTCARPSEVFRLIRAHHQVLNPDTGKPYGTFITLDGESAPIAFETRSKTEGVTGAPRLLVLSAEALSHLHLSLPQWQHSYFLELAIEATKRLGPDGTKTSEPRGAKVLRSFGASALRNAGTPREDVKRILGHSTIEPADHYIDESLALLRAYLSRLTLRFAPASTEDDEWVPPT